jgi:hypothetical protein
MIDNTQFQNVQKATSDGVNSSHETSPTVADSLVTLQGCYLRFAQSIFQTWIEVLTPQAQSMPRVQSGEQLIQKQQDAFWKLISPPMQLSLDFLLAPFTLSRKLVETSMIATQREQELVS